MFQEEMGTSGRKGRLLRSGLTGFRISFTPMAHPALNHLSAKQDKSDIVPHLGPLNTNGSQTSGTSSAGVCAGCRNQARRMQPGKPSLMVLQLAAPGPERSSVALKSWLKPMRPMTSKDSHCRAPSMSMA